MYREEEPQKRLNPHPGLLRWEGRGLCLINDKRKSTENKESALKLKITKHPIFSKPGIYCLALLYWIVSVSREKHLLFTMAVANLYML